MHCALAVPELVGAIINMGAGSQSFMASCMLVNRMFYAESERIIWRRVGIRISNVSDTSSSPSLPQVRHLVAMAEKDSNDGHCSAVIRAQHYITLMHHICFALGREDRIKTFFIPNGYDDDPKHSNQAFLRPILALARFEFPALEIVEFRGGPFDKQHIPPTEAAMLQYARHTRRSFTLEHGPPLTAGFFDRLASQSPRLRRLSIHLKASLDVADVSFDSLARFFRSLPELEDLYLELPSHASPG